MKTLRRGGRDADTIVMLQELLNAAGHPVEVDGVFGVATDQVVRAYQESSGLVVDGVVGDQTWLRLLADAPDYASGRAGRFLTEKDLLRAADTLQVELAAVKAVTEVEASGHGFVGGKPKILFEGHVFWKQLKACGLDPRACRDGNQDILYPKWTREHYLGGVREHERLARGRRIHDQAALGSASWGLFQIMGYHAPSLGYAGVCAFADAMAVGEGPQLDAFASFLEVNDLARHLREHAWATFARRYNGPRYRDNRYDEKLEKAYLRYSEPLRSGRAPSAPPTVRAPAESADRGSADTSRRGRSGGGAAARRSSPGASRP